MATTIEGTAVRPADTSPAHPADDERSTAVARFVTGLARVYAGLPLFP